MKHALRQLVLMTAAATALAATGLAQADSLFGGGNRDFSGQRFEKDNADKDKPHKDKGGGSQGGSSSNWPASARVDTPNQVPEPETLGLVAIGLLAAWAASRRRKD